MSKSLRILMVEDSEDDALLLKRKLERGGYSIIYERVDSAEAMSSAMDQYSWDIIICDYSIPGFNGLAALKHFKEREIDIPFIIVSGAIGENIAVQTMKAGAHDYLMKDNLTRLIPAIERELRESEIRRERKQVQETIKASEERFRALYHDNPSMYFTVNNDAIILSVNRFGAEQLGYSIEDMVGKSVLNFFFSEDRKPFLDSIRTCLKNPHKLVKWEFRKIKKDGSIAWVKETARVVQQADGQTVLLIVCEDVTELKQVEQAIIESERKLSSIIQRSPLPVFVINTEHKLIYWNKACEELTKIKSNDLLYTTQHWKAFYEKERPCLVDLLVDEKDIKNLAGYYTKIKKSELIEEAYESMGFYPLLGPEGKWLHITAAAIRDSSGSLAGAIETIVDVTETKNSEAALRESEIKYRTLFDGVPIGLFRTKPSGIILNANRKTVQMFGYTSENYMNNINLFDLCVNDDDQTRFKTLIQKDGIVHNFEIDMRKNDGIIIHTRLNCSCVKDETGALLYYEGSLEDITEHKKFENALIKSEIRFRELFDGAPIGYHEVDTNGLIVQVNRTEAEMLGYEVNEMLNHRIWEFLLEKEDSISDFNLKIEGRMIPDIAYERTFLRKNGTTISTLVEDVLLKNSEGLISGIRSTIQDITERKQNEIAINESNRRLEETLMELRETQKQVLQQERLRAIGQMASGIAHDINNSLSPIIGYSDLMFRNEEIMKIARKPVTLINKAGKDIKHTIDRMKEFYRPKNDNIQNGIINLNKIIESTIDLTKHRWKDIAESQGIDILIKTEFRDGLPSIKGNESEIREALTNLVINAADAMPEGGTLYLKSFLIVDKIIIEVQDTGTGMDEETLLHCLDPFYTTKGDKGTGLGLSMVYGIMQRHNGHLIVESKKGQGTLIKLIFPSADVISTENPEEEFFQFPSMKILCIDDIIEVREMLSEMLSKNNQRVILSDSGKNGLKMFFEANNKGEPFDLVITDLGMPYPDGKSVAEAIKSKYPQIPIILMTGWGSFLEQDSIKNVDYILRKPILLDDLSKALKTVLGKT